ncbi:MAG: EAL domain-containing protein [Terracidiphilus sp.]|jgi:sensor c-di-GMP phosphodiesterase-like protein
MASRKRRLLITLATMIVTTVTGTLAGYQLARAIAARVIESKLFQYTNLLVADGEASSAELRTVLAAVSASQHRSCSTDEIAYFRALIFESDYLKDAGRMHDGKIECSAALGKLAQPRGPFLPDLTLQDGMAIHTSLAPYRNPDLTVLALQSGDSYVVFTPLTRMHLLPLPMHYTETSMDAPSQSHRHLLGETSQASLPILTVEGEHWQGETLYASRCSIRFFNCVTTYSSMPEIIQANRTRFLGCIFLCSAFGALVGLISSLLYRRNKSIEHQLRRAIREDKLRMVYQPIVHLPSARIVGTEALVRWTDEEGCAISPDVFVRTAEQCGFVGEITKLVLRHVLRDFGETLRKRPDFRLCINVAAADLSDPEFLAMLDRCLNRAAVAACSLVIEITEGSTARHEIAIETIRSLRQRGHCVHIDDFGTGYSSLAYLHELSVDAIKIDKSFTQAIGTESVVVAILPQILAMAEALDLKVIVEGIETPVQAHYFEGFAQPILAQGWLYGHPVAADKFLRLLIAEDKKSLQPANAA